MRGNKHWYTSLKTHGAPAKPWTSRRFPVWSPLQACVHIAVQPCQPKICFFADAAWPLVWCCSIKEKNKDFLCLFSHLFPPANCIIYKTKNRYGIIFPFFPPPHARNWLRSLISSREFFLTTDVQTVCLSLCCIEISTGRGIFEDSKGPTSNGHGPNPQSTPKNTLNLRQNNQ